MRMLVFVLALALVGCAHGKTRNRARLALVLTGLGTTGLGGLVTAGCKQNMTGCGGGPDDVNLAVGVPMMITGVVLVTTGLLLNLPPPKTAGPPKPAGPEWTSRGY